MSEVRTTRLMGRSDISVVTCEGKNRASYIIYHCFDKPTLQKIGDYLYTGKTMANKHPNFPLDQRSKDLSTWDQNRSMELLILRLEWSSCHQTDKKTPPEPGTISTNSESTTNNFTRLNRVMISAPNQILQCRSRLMSVAYQ